METFPLKWKANGNKMESKWKLLYNSNDGLWCKKNNNLLHFPIQKLAKIFPKMS